MKRRAAVLSAALAAAVAGIAVVSSNAQQPGPPTGTLELVQRAGESTFRHIDHLPRGGGPRAPSPGDVAITGGTLRHLQPAGRKGARGVHETQGEKEGPRRPSQRHLRSEGRSDRHGRSFGRRAYGRCGEHRRHRHLRGRARHDAGQLYEDEGAHTADLHRLIRLTGWQRGRAHIWLTFIG
jgi:hypothetical protein